MAKAAEAKAQWLVAEEGRKERAAALLLLFLRFLRVLACLLEVEQAAADGKAGKVNQKATGVVRM